MIDKNIIDDATMAYLHAYNKAIQMTGDQNKAATAAAAIAFIVMNTPEKKQGEIFEIFLSREIKNRDKKKRCEDNEDGNP